MSDADAVAARRARDARVAVFRLERLAPLVGADELRGWDHIDPGCRARWRAYYEKEVGRADLRP